MTFELFFLVLTTFMVSSLIKGWSGFGTNLIAMPVLASMLGYSLADSVTIVISVNIFMNIAILVENKKFNIQSLANIKWMVVFGVLFTIVGAYFLKDPSNAYWIKIVAGSVIVLTGLYKIFTKLKDLKVLFYEETMNKYYIPTGIISGIFNGIAGLGGLPALILLSNSDMDKNKFRTTLVSYFFVMNLVAIIGYLIAGNYNTFVLQNIGLMIIPAVATCMFGVYLSRRVSDKIFSSVMIGVLIFMGANLVVNAVFKTNILTYIIELW